MSIIITCKLGKLITVTKERWLLITQVKHRELVEKEREIKKTLQDPDEIRLSKKDKSVYLYYKKFNKLSLAAVIKHNNRTGFLITGYFTDRIKEGKPIFKR